MNNKPCLFQVLYQRVLSLQEGQVLLTEMAEQIRLLPYGTTWQVVKIPGVNRYGNPFPEWLARLLESAGCRFEDINMVYQVRCEEERANMLMRWFEYELRPWASSDPRWADYMRSVNSRIMDMSGEIQRVYDSF